MTTTVTIQNFGTFQIPTEKVNELINWVQNNQIFNPNQEQFREVLQSHLPNDGRVVING